MKKSALVLGATGLVGRQIALQLLADSRYTKIHLFGRRSSGISHARLEEHVINFDQIGEWQELLSGDVLFSALGTTIKAARSREAQYNVDFTYQYQVAEKAAENGVTTLVLVSSYGADSKSKIFYSRIKGELDQAVKKLPFKSIRILKPSLLTGERENPRTSEKVMASIGNILLPLIPGLKKFRPIAADIVAKAAICAANDDEQPPIREYKLNEIFDLANSGRS